MTFLRRGFAAFGIFVALLIVCTPPTATAQDAPTPLLEQGQPVDWWFVFKFNSKSFPRCDSSNSVKRTCSFGGTVQPYTQYGQQFVYASSANPELQKGDGCAGETTTDPVGATFDEVYNQPFFFVVWNDQFYDAPKIQGLHPILRRALGAFKGDAGLG